MWKNIYVCLSRTAFDKLFKVFYEITSINRFQENKNDDEETEAFILITTAINNNPRISCR